MVATLQAKYYRLCSMMNEKLRRHWAACEALALGRGGMSTVASATRVVSEHDSSGNP